MNFKFLQLGYFIVIVALFLYSFTQVDLSLTLSQVSAWQVVQQQFQYIGYFQRPSSTVLYISIISLLFIFYIIFLRLAHAQKMTRKQFWSILIPAAILLGFSYNAFSYDIFNYIFDAKIITYYGQSPYEHKALDFPGDPMLSFMHWTHRVYPYGPVWLGVTAPLSFLGLGLFLPTFFLFKVLITSSFIGTVYFIGKITQLISPKDSVFTMVFFGLSPLVLVEGLVSAHNDIVMLFLAIVAMYFMVKKRLFTSVFFLALSFGVKFATVFLFPVYAYTLFQYARNKHINWQAVFLIATVCMCVATAAVSIRTNFQPWYLLYPLPFAALISKRYYLVIPSVILSVFALLQYVPFLYLGNWDAPVPSILFWLTITGILAAVVSIVGYNYAHTHKT